MSEYDDTTYGDRIADVFDDIMAFPAAETNAAVDELFRLAAGGPVLELGIGTGRVALPLAGRGIAVQGIDSSRKMIDILRSKPSGQDLDVQLGDFAVDVVPGQFKLVFVVFNTLFVLRTQEAQVQCFRTVAKMLSADGCFVVEAFVPDLTRYTNNQSLVTSEIGVDRLRIDASVLDSVQQVIRAQQLVVTEQGVRLYPVELRYVWPSEMDLMARVAGLELADRWSDWKHAPFTASSTKHVSVYRRAR